MAMSLRTRVLVPSPWKASDLGAALNMWSPSLDLSCSIFSRASLLMLAPYDAWSAISEILCPLGPIAPIFGGFMFWFDDW